MPHFTISFQSVYACQLFNIVLNKILQWEKTLWIKTATVIGWTICSSCFDWLQFYVSQHGVRDMTTLVFYLHLLRRCASISDKSGDPFYFCLIFVRFWYMEDYFLTETILNSLNFNLWHKIPNPRPPS